MTISEIAGEDHLDDLLAFYPEVFPDEDLRPLVQALLTGDHPVLSLVGRGAGRILGHCLFTRVGAAGVGALLGPLGVLPKHQRAGIGSVLVRSGIERLSADGVPQVFVLGDPGYYGRFGFAPETKVETPCPIPMDWGPA